ncbi:MAG TPA: amidohydrolase family protein [Terriglobales bacterium]|jgi:predicted TIM-barrel fold metal-dependent hydrolase|nr:amidohydrolase family protein [Terriglobales bacterium]
MIDFHTHPVLIRELVEKYPDYGRSARTIFNIGNNFQPLETFLLQMDVAAIDRAVLLPIECSRARGLAVSSNEQVAELCTVNDRFVGFASVDPRRNGAVREFESSVKDMGLCGLKLDPALQDFDPVEPGAVELYEAAEALGVPVLMHVGMSWAPETPLQRGQPLALEPVIRRFSKLNFVLAHFAWPWIWDTVALMMKYPNVYADTSCLYYDSPREFFQFVFSKQLPATLVERSLRNRVVFGSNYPRVEIKNMVHALKSLPLTDETLRRILHGNAERLLGVGAPKSSATVAD